MAAGVPTVVARAASLPEDAALYFDPLQVEDIADKLVTIATDSILRAHLVKKGLERSMLFTWELCSTQTSQALRDTLYAPPG
jgi:glycosyltransferase involved in cell wall biosynthesis